GVVGALAGVAGGIQTIIRDNRAAARAALLALYARERAILKCTNDATGRTHLLPGGQFAIPALTKLRGADLLTVADALTSKFTHSNAPFYRSSVNQERTLRALRDAQRLA